MKRVSVGELTDQPGDPIHTLAYLNAAPRRGTEIAHLPFVRGSLVVSDPLADELDAVIACSDLQGLVPPSQLLGIAVAEALEELAFDGVIPPAARTGVILAGDLFAVANKRGGYGDVAEVWHAFAERFAWVAGVAGNHDDVSSVRGLPNAHVLDGEVVELDGLRIGGVSGIVGNPDKRNRRSEDDFLAQLSRTLDDQPSIVVLHEGPHGDRDQPGNAAVRELLAVSGAGLTICGHSHWHTPIAELAADAQVLNVDTRVAVLVVRR